MRVINKTQKTVISDHAKFLNSLTDKSVGLLSNLNQNLIFKTRFGIHTFFLRQPIDVLILDQNKKVIKTKINLKPWRLFFWNPKSDLVIELNSGQIAKSKTKLDDIIEIIN